jgi:hypothetical protein
VEATMNINNVRLRYLMMLLLMSNVEEAKS